MTDHKNIEEVIGLYNTKVQGVIRRFFPASPDVEDLEQEVYIKTWKNLPKYRGEASLWSWLNRITVNVCKDHLRSNKKSKLNLTDAEESVHNIPDKADHPEKSLILSERHRLILDSIDKLSPKFREVLLLHDIDELTYEEISKKVKCPIGTVKSRLFNARKALKEELGELLT